MSQPSPIPARVLQRHQSQIARDLLATLKPIRSLDDQHERQCGQRTHSGMGHQALGLRTLLHFLLHRLTQFSDRGGSVDPAIPADRAVAGSPRVPTGTIPVVSVPAPATASSCSGDLHSGPPPATGSSCACAPAPCGAGATAVAADHDSPNSVPRSGESHPSAASAEYAVHPGDPSSAYAPAS